jgi:hypothetical protein
MHRAQELGVSPLLEKHPGEVGPGVVFTAAIAELHKQLQALR